ncbi:MAG: zinc ribbon domain-containing protein [Sulfurimonas sp.]
MNRFKKWLKTYKDSILIVENKELTNGSKASLIIFVIIVFVIIGTGVERQQSYILKPNKQFSYKCMNLLEKNKGIDDFQTRDVTKDIYDTYYRYKYWSLGDFRYNHQRKSEKNVLYIFGTNKLCQEVGIRYLDVANSDEFEDKLIIQKGLKKKISSLNQSISRKTDEYSNTLLENIAKQDISYSILSTTSKTIKKELKESRKKLAILNDELSKIEDVTILEEFKIFKRFIDKNTKEIYSQHRDAIKYYRLKYTLNIFVFLFPVWLLFYISYRVLKKKNFYITSHLSLNVANVSALYIVFNIFLLVYTIIPKIFFNKLIYFLSQYNLTLVLNIIAILFFMAFFGFFIRRIQKNNLKDIVADNAGTIRNSRLKNFNTCIKCGNKHNLEDKFCGFCSHKLKQKCKVCEHEVSSDYGFCTNCDVKL